MSVQLIFNWKNKNYTLLLMPHELSLREIEKEKEREREREKGRERERIEREREREREREGSGKQRRLWMIPLRTYIAVVGESSQDAPRPFQENHCQYTNVC